jgi:hypothetical protein
MYSGIDYNAE